MKKLIDYYGEQISVPEEVADFLENDRKEMAAQERQDRRRLSKSSFETVPDSYRCTECHNLEDLVFQNLSFENLRTMIAALNSEEQELIHFRFKEEMTLEEIGTRFGVSKAAISKRLKKLVQKLRDRVEYRDPLILFGNFFCRLTNVFQVSLYMRGFIFKRGRLPAQTDYLAHSRPSSRLFKCKGGVNMLSENKSNHLNLSVTGRQRQPLSKNSLTKVYHSKGTKTRGIL